MGIDYFMQGINLSDGLIAGFCVNRDKSEIKSCACTVFIKKFELTNKRLSLEIILSAVVV